MVIPNSSRENLGKIIKQQRLSVPLTLYELSHKSGVSPSHLGRIENGERFPSAAILQRIARPLGFREPELFTLAGYLTPQLLASSDNTAEPLPGKNSRLDPYVNKILSQEPVEIQRAVVGILSIMKGMAVAIDTVKKPDAEAVK
jgi:transcriptional regulator with XRE-family HTH domain